MIKTVLKQSSLPKPYFYVSLMVFIGLGILFIYLFIFLGERSLYLQCL